MCKCAMDGDNGYCGEVLGTKIYSDYAKAMLPIYAASNCHTLDRDDIRA